MEKTKNETACVVRLVTDSAPANSQRIARLLYGHQLPQFIVAKYHNTWEIIESFYVVEGTLLGVIMGHNIWKDT